MVVDSKGHFCVNHYDDALKIIKALEGMGYILDYNYHHEYASMRFSGTDTKIGIFVEVKDNK